eukprot:jgi/Chlat1/8667/Chrsp87S08044
MAATVVAALGLSCRSSEDESSSGRTSAWPARPGRPCRRVVCPVRASGSSAAAASQLPPPDVRKLASLSRLHVSEEEAEELGPQIAGVVAWFGQLQAIDVEGVPPATRAGDGYEAETGPNVLREDKPVAFDNREAMLSAVPDMEGPYIRVPQILATEE